MELLTTASDITSKAVFDTLDSVGWNVEPISPITKSLPFLASPAPLLACLAVYFAIVGAGLLTITPSDSKVPRKSFFGEYYVVIFHNFFLFALSAYMCGKIIYEAVQNKYSVWGNFYDVSQVEMGKVIYVFYVSKIYEFFDTFIMLAKGNMKQVSFLHVYHHCTISFVWWMIAYHAPGGDAYFSAAANSFVHIWMYLYYFMAHVLPKDTATRKKYLWWGKYLTQLQLTQFCANLSHSVWLLHQPTEYMPKFLQELLLWYMISLITLFGHFYYTKHLAGASSKKKPGKKTN